MRSGNVIIYSTVLLILIFNARPAILGQMLGGIYFIICVAALLLNVYINKKIKVNIEVFNIYLLYILFYAYAYVQSIILGLDNLTEIISSFLLISIGMFGLFVLRKSVLKKAFRVLSIIFVVFTVSYILSYLLMFLWSPIQVFDITLQMGSKSTYIYPIQFPFSIMYDGTVKVLSQSLPRAIANFREPGLLQFIVIFLYWGNYYLQIRNYKFLNILLLILLVFTFSTAGYLSFGVTILYYYFFKKGNRLKKFVIPAIIVFVFGILLLNSASEFSLESKFDNRSGLVRLEAALVSYDLIRSHPFLGIGFYETYKDVPIGINFLGTIAQLGLLGTFLVLLPIIYTAYIVWAYNRKYLILIIPLVLTLLFSQPLYDKAITIFILTFTAYLASNDPKNLYNNPILQSRYILRRNDFVSNQSKLSQS